MYVKHEQMDTQTAWENLLQAIYERAVEDINAYRTGTRHIVSTSNQCYHSAVRFIKTNPYGYYSDDVTEYIVERLDI